MRKFPLQTDDQKLSRHRQRRSHRTAALSTARPTARSLHGQNDRRGKTAVALETDHGLHHQLHRHRRGQSRDPLRGRRMRAGRNPGQSHRLRRRPDRQQAETATFNATSLTATKTELESAGQQDRMERRLPHRSIRMAPRTGAERLLVSARPAGRERQGLPLALAVVWGPGIENVAQ